MKWWLAVSLALLACKDKPASAPAQGAPVMPAAEAAPATPAPAKPDDLDEKMRHCPLAIDGATTTLGDIAGGVQFEIEVAGPQAIAEVQRRARHLVEFAAGRHEQGTHGGGQGGGKMRNCPIVTSGVTIVQEELAGGARIVVTVPDARVPDLRAETRRRASTFPYVGATIVDASAPR